MLITKIEQHTQTTSNPFHIVGQMMNKNASHFSANYAHRIAISFQRCHSSDLIFKIIIEIQVQWNFITYLKVVSEIVMTPFSEAATCKERYIIPVKSYTVDSRYLEHSISQTLLNLEQFVRLSCYNFFFNFSSQISLFSTLTRTTVAIVPGKMSIDSHIF